MEFLQKLFADKKSIRGKLLIEAAKEVHPLGNHFRRETHCQVLSMFVDIHVFEVSAIPSGHFIFAEGS